MKDGIPLLAVALSGPSGGFLPAMLPDKAIRLPKILDKEGNETAEFKYPTISKTPTDIRLLPLDVDASREIGFMLGAGIVVYGTTADLLDQAIACSQFYHRLSCGMCVPCRLGSRKIVDMAQQLASSQTDQNLVPQFVDHANLLSRIMRTTSICGLGQVASEPFRTYLRYFHPTNR
jgi:NADH:ubiquinone oxidoreductase subunit F (NADH-binding)